MTDAVDKKIISYLEKEKGKLTVPPDRLNVGPTAEEFYLFIENRLPQDAEERVLNYLKTHPEARSMVQTARQLLVDASESGREEVAGTLLRKARDLFGSLTCPHCGGPISPFKSPLAKQKAKNALWAVFAVTAFLGSFLIPRYFFQFLAISLFCGFRWVMDQRATKTQILIYKALSEQDFSDTKHRDLHQSSSQL